MPVGDYTVADLSSRVVKMLANRQDALANAPTWIQQTAIELTRNYDFAELQYTGPTVQFIPFQNNYDKSYFVQPAHAAYDIPRIISWFVYYYGSAPVSSSSSSGTNAGLNLQWKTIDGIEQLMQYSGPPVYWSRNGYTNGLYVAMSPDQAYYTYQRYQIQHPFTHLITEDPSVPDSTNIIYVSDDWIEILEYSAALRGASDLRMPDLESKFYNILFGDPEFQRSSGGRGMPGLIARRLSRMENDNISMSGQFRPVVRR